MLIKRILLGMVVLAIIVVSFMLYSMLVGPTVVEEPAGQETTTTMPIKPLAARPVGTADLTSPEDALMTGEGVRAKFDRYSKSGTIAYQFLCDHWKPAGTEAGKFILDKPELRVFLRGGQILHVSAAEGEIVATQSKINRLEPKRGQLRGKVHIYIDRAIDPNRSVPEQRPEDMLHIWLDRVDFDLVKNIIESKSPVRVESEEAELVGEILTISWNELTSQIEDITIARGEKLILRQGFDMMNPDLPFADRMKREKAGAKGAGKDRVGKAAFSRTAVAKSDLVYPDRKTATSSSPTSTKTSTQPRPFKSYDLVFTSTVRINQYADHKLTGKMTCDKLHVIFDVPHGSESRDADPLRSKKEATTRKAPRDNSKRLEIFWEGPLQMRPKILPFSAVRRFHIEALGQPILIEQTDPSNPGKVRCKKLAYYQESKQLSLEGTTDEPVNVTQGAARTIVAAKLFYDRKAGVASGTGPGFMQQESTGKPSGTSGGPLSLDTFDDPNQSMIVRWMEGFRLNFGEYQKVDAAGPVTRQFLTRAVFRGAARVQRSGELMAGDVVDLKFATPDSTDATGEKLTNLYAEGSVVLRSEQKQINCDRLNVEFSQQGRVPKIARAKGHVRVQEGRRLISADDLTATMEEHRIEPPAGQAVTAKKKPKSKTEVVIREVDANGNVCIRDPRQPVNVDCHKMHAILDANRTIRWCYLEGADQNWARAELKSYGIAGSKITMDLSTEQIDVPGAGELQFDSPQDIVESGGGPEKTARIVINWSDSMKLAGGDKNQGVFLGQTKVRSDRTTLHCARLLVDFENVPEPATKPAPTKSGSATGRFWVFSKFLEPGRDKDTEVRAPITRKRPRFIQAFPESGKELAIQYLVKNADRIVNCTTLWGKELTVDLSANRLNMPGVGRLFIEDYRLPDETKPAVRRTMGKTAGMPGMKDPFGADLESIGPSQTGFTWKNGLTYMLDSRTALFDGNVTMLLVAGSKLIADRAGRMNFEGKPSRQSTLACENLKVEFLRGGFGFSGQSSSGAAEVKSIVATGAVNLQDKPRSILAQRVLYNRAENVIAVYGTDQDPAILYEEDADSGEYTMYDGPWILWDRNKNQIKAPHAKLTSTMR